MPPFRKPTLVTLRRSHPTQAWGFRLGGGAEIGQPFQVQKVTPGSLAFLGGISEGDELVRIGNISLRGLTHDEVQQIILRCCYCIDLFLFRDDGGDINPRFELVNQPEMFSKQEVYPRLTSAPVSPTIRSVEQSPFVLSSSSDLPISKPMVVQNNLNSNVEMMQGADFNRSPQPFDGMSNTSAVSPKSHQPQPALGVTPMTRQLSMTMVETKPGSPIRDPRVFGVSSRGGSKSPFQPPSLSRENSFSPNPSIANHNQTAIPMQQSAAAIVSQSVPSTPAINKTAEKQFAFDPTDFNNNPMSNGLDKQKIFGLPARGASKTIAPLGNHGIQPITNERKYFGLSPTQRHNSFSCDRDWKTSLPIVNIPNTDQLLPSQTRQMQTYINQTPPTEKNLRPSLIGLERRRIRPVWPPPHPGRIRSGVHIEGRDSPNSKMFAWPPPRAQSVDRDFSYGEGRQMRGSSFGRAQTPDRSESPFYSGRVNSSCKIWPPPSNATPAGASGYIPEGDEENYAYNASGHSLPGLVNSHIPPTYRPPPGTQHLMVNDF